MKCLNTNEPEMNPKKLKKSKKLHKLMKNLVNEVIKQDNTFGHEKITTKPKKSHKRSKEIITADFTILQSSKKRRHEENVSNIKSKHNEQMNMVTEVISQDNTLEQEKVATKTKKSRKMSKENISAINILDNTILQSNKKPRLEENTSNIKSKHNETELEANTLENIQSQNTPHIDTDDVEIPQAYIKWKKENQPTYLNISKQAALDTIAFLEQPEKRSIQKRFNLNCINKLPYSDCLNSSWDSASYLTSAVRNCLLNREFHLLPEFIKIFMQLGFSKTYYNHAKELAYLNFLVSADGNAYDDELLEEFVQMFFVRVGRERKDNEFDVWYRE